MLAPAGPGGPAGRRETFPSVAGRYNHPGWLPVQAPSQAPEERTRPVPRPHRRFLTWSLALLALPLTALRADEQPAAVPKGEVTKYTFDKSKIFPGTVRDYWVYVPKQYDPAKSACVHVNQDGIQYNAPAIFDQLIDRKSTRLNSSHVKISYAVFCLK